jgi:hypothetical protein
MARTAFESLPDSQDASAPETDSFSDSFFKEPSKLSGGEAAQAPPIGRQRSVTNRIRAEDLAARGIPSYRNASGDVSAVRDESGAALTGFQQKAGIAYDSKGQPKQISYDETGPPKISDPFDKIPAHTDPKTGAIEKYGPGGIYQYVGQDAEVTSKVAQKASDKDLSKESSLLGRKLSLDEHDLVQGTKQQKQLHSDLTTAVPTLLDPKYHGADHETVQKAIDEHFDAQYAAPEANKTSGFFSGELSPEAKALRADIDAKKAKAYDTSQQIFDLNDKLSGLHDNIQSGRSKERDQVETLLAHQQGGKGPLDQQQADETQGGGEKSSPGLYPPAEDWPRILGGSDAAKAVAGGDREKGATPASLQNVNLTPADKLNAPYEQGQKSYRVGEDKSFNLDPSNMVKGLRQAVEDGVVDGEKAKEVLPKIKPLQDAIDARNQLIKDAGGADKLKALGHGAIIGSAFLASAAPGAKLGALGGAAIPIAGETGIPEAVGAVLGGLVTGTLGAWGAKTALDKLGETNAAIKSLTASAELHPILDNAGQLISFAAGGIGGVRNLYKLGQVASESVADLGATASRMQAIRTVGKFMGVQGLTGAGFELAVRPAFDAARYAAADALGIKHDQFQAPSVSSVLTQAALGVLIGSRSIEFKSYTAKDVASVLFRARMRNEAGIDLAESDPAKVGAAVDAFSKKMGGAGLDSIQAQAFSKPLTPQETHLYNALKTKVARMDQSGAFDEANGVTFQSGTQARIPVFGKREGEAIASAGVEPTFKEGKGGGKTKAPIPPTEPPKALTQGGEKSNEPVSTSADKGKGERPSSSEPARPESKVAQPDNANA